MTDRFVRKIHIRDNYRVVIKDNGEEIEIGSIGGQHGSSGGDAYRRYFSIGI